MVLLRRVDELEVRREGAHQVDEAIRIEAGDDLHQLRLHAFPPAGRQPTVLRAQRLGQGPQALLGVEEAPARLLDEHLSEKVPEERDVRAQAGVAVRARAGRPSLRGRPDPVPARLVRGQSARVVWPDQ